MGWMCAAEPLVARTESPEQSSPGKGLWRGQARPPAADARARKRAQRTHDTRRGERGDSAVKAARGAQGSERQEILSSIVQGYIEAAKVAATSPPSSSSSLLLLAPPRSSHLLLLPRPAYESGGSAGPCLARRP